MRMIRISVWVSVSGRGTGSAGGSRCRSAGMTRARLLVSSTHRFSCPESWLALGLVSRACLPADAGAARPKQSAGRQCCNFSRIMRVALPPAMYAPHVLPAARDYDALYRSFRWQVPAHYNIGVDVCDRWARSRAGPHRHLQRACRRRRRRDQLRLRCARPRTGSPTCCAARGIRRGDRVAILLPQAPAVAAAISPSTSSAPSRCRWRCCSASRRSPTGSRIPARGR